MGIDVRVGDAREVLAQMPAESVHCVVTSPPYWGLRSYLGGDGMLGLESTFDEHLENLVAVFREVRRVLRKDGTCWINYGDAYASTPPGNKAKGLEKWKTSGLHGAVTSAKYAETLDNSQGQKRNTIIGSGLKPKDLMLMPARVAMALQADGVPDAKALAAIERAENAIINAYDGEPPDRAMAALEALAAEYAEAKGDSWWLRSEIVWHKPNPMPESVTDRPTSAHEKLFLLSKAKSYFYDAEAVRVPVTGNAHARRSDGERLPAKGTEEGDNRTGSWQESYVPSSANLRNVWTIPTHGFSAAHFATFPPALVEPCIKAGTSEKGACAECGAPWVRETKTEYRRHEKWFGGKQAARHSRGKAGQSYNEPISTTTTGWSPSCGCRQPDFGAPYPTKRCVVLDPFAGSGTVGLVADRLQRAAILIEISPEYADMARKRVTEDAPLFAETTA